MKLKKHITMVLTFVMILQMVLSNSLITLVEAASSDITSSIKFLTGVKVTDENGNEISENLGKNDIIRANYTWEISEADNIESGDYYILDLPKGVKISDDITRDILDQDGNKVADLQVFKDGSLKFIFTDYAQNNKPIKGEMYVECGFNEDEIDGGKIDFEVNGDSETIIIDFSTPEEEISLEHSGVYNGDGTITWTIDINKENAKIIKGSKVTSTIKKDNLESHKYIKGSETISGNANGTFVYDEEGNFFTYTFNEESEEEHIITFKTEVGFNANGNKLISVEDNAKIQNGKEVSESLAVVKIPLGDIQKTGIYDWQENKIDWTIVINKDNKSLKNIGIKDVLSEGLLLKEDSIKVSPELENGNCNYNESTRELIYNLGDIDKEYTISFSTYISLENNEANTEECIFKNTAELLGNGHVLCESTSEVKTPIYLIRKNFIGYNPTSGEITWSISINETGSNLKNARLEDDILSGQKFVEGSFTLQDKRTNEDKFDSSKFFYDDTKNDERTGKITYDFGDINKPYYITFKTKITDYSNPIDLFKIFFNKSILYFGDRYHTGHDEYRISEKTLLKEGIDYDYINKVATWKIKVNQNNFPITNGVVTDNIPSGQEYIKDSFKISSNANGQLKHEVVSDENTERLTYTFNDKISSGYEMEFKTKITDLSVFEEDGAKKVYNEAFLDGDEIDTTISSKAELDVENPLVKKTFKYDKGNDYIDWFVEGNTENKPIKGAIIEDALQDGLILETDTIKLNKLVKNQSGMYEVGDEVALSSENIKYDIKTNKLVFTFPNDFEGAFKLSFRTTVTKEGTYKNSITFKGVSNESSTTKETEVDGWAEVKKGSIKIIKVDGEDESKTLSGAEFELLDEYGNVIRTSIPTDENGVVIFDNLKHNVEYMIRETVAPVGYEKVSEPCKVTLKDNNIEYKFKNIKTHTIIPNDGSILVNKLNEDEEHLEGVEFTLYDSEGKVVEVKKTNIYGLAEFKNLTYGKYVLKETKELPGYKPADKEFNVEVTESNKWVFVGTVVNEKLPVNPSDGAILVNKVNSDKENLEGVEFTLYDSEGKVVEVKKTNEYGLAEFKNLTYGKYVLKETKELPGYKPIDKEFNVELTESNKWVSVGTVVNEKLPASPSDGSILVNKLNEEEEHLEGVEFTLYDSEGKIVEVKKTDIYGLAEFKNLTYGKYVLKETKELPGYKPADKEFNVEVTESNKWVFVGTVVNEKLPVNPSDGAILVNKVNSDKENLEGVEFTLYDSEGKVVEVKKTNEYGLAEFKNITYGKYVLKETKELPGYKPIDKEFNVEVTESNKWVFVGTVVNEKY